MIAPQHQRVIDLIVDLFKDDPCFPAMIVGGSVAKGRALTNSDVDILLIANDEEYARRVTSNDFVITQVAMRKGVSYDQLLVQFLRDPEWTWRDGRAPLQDCTRLTRLHWAVGYGEPGLTAN